MKDLFFSYPDTARIRIKFSSVLQSPDHPAVYRVKTRKLDFLIPKQAVILGKTHAYIPLFVYRNVLINHTVNYSPVQLNLF